MSTVQIHTAHSIVDEASLMNLVRRIKEQNDLYHEAFGEYLTKTSKLEIITTVVTMDSGYVPKPVYSFIHENAPTKNMIALLMLRKHEK